MCNAKSIDYINGNLCKSVKICVIRVLSRILAIHYNIGVSSYERLLSIDIFSWLNYHVYIDEE